MKMMKKIIALSLSLVLCLALFGCIAKPSVETGNKYDVNIDLDKNISATLKITTYENERQLFDDLFAEFNKTYPNVKLDFDVLSGGLYSTMQGYYGGNQMPDIMINQSFDMLALDGAKMLLDLTPYIAAERESTLPGAFREEDYFDYFWQLGKKNFEGGQIMMPRLSDQVVVAYNKDILKAAGVDFSVIKNGWTWDDFLSVCAKVKAKYVEDKNILPIMDSYITWEAVFNAILESHGVEYFKDGKVAIDSQATRNALDTIRELREKGYIGKTSSSAARFDNAQGAFLIHSRSAGDTITALRKNASGYSDLTNQQISEKIGFVSFPLIMKNKTPKIGAGVAGYSIASTSKNRDIAWQFVKFMLSKVGQNIFAKNGISGPPMREDMMDIADETNLWAADFKDFNLNAYTYGREEGYVTATTFMVERASKANDIVGAVSQMISNYIDTDVSDLNEKKDSLLKWAREELEYWAYQA